MLVTMATKANPRAVSAASSSAERGTMTSSRLHRGGRCTLSSWPGAEAARGSCFGAYCSTSYRGWDAGGGRSVAVGWIAWWPESTTTSCGDGAHQLGMDVERPVETERPETVSFDPAGRHRGSALSRGIARRVTILCDGERWHFPKATKGRKGQSLRR